MSQFVFVPVQHVSVTACRCISFFCLLNSTLRPCVGDTVAMAGVNGKVEPTSGDSLDPVDYDYDLIVIGGGSGGLSLAKVGAGV